MFRNPRDTIIREDDQYTYLKSSEDIDINININQ